MNTEEFIKEIEKLNIKITEEQLNKLEKYYSYLIEKNKVMNLTAITEKDEVYLKHFYDSLTLIKAIDLNKNIKICDVGTGAGFPGIVLKIVFPNLNITLVDALEKRINFLNEVINILDLKNIKTYHDRIENFSKKHIEEFDIITSRAVAKTNILLELSSNLVKKEGYAIFLKGEINEELMTSKQAIKTLGFKVDNIINFTLPKENSTRTILKLKKIEKTNKKYPREFSKIKNKPL